MAKYEITGQVLAQRNNQGIRDLRVEAWDKDIKYDDLLGCSMTDGRGGFYISFDSNYFREHSPEKQPDVFFKVYQDEKLLKNTQKTPIHNAGEILSPIIIEVDLDVPDAVVRPEGRDRVTAAQALKAADFFKESDFLGVFTQYRSKATTSLGFLSDMVVNSLNSLDFTTPIKPSADLRGQNTYDVKKQLESQNITVECVRPYTPQLNASSFKAFSLLSPNLQSGQRVHLYEDQDRVVRHVTVVGENCPPQTNDTILDGTPQGFQEIQQALDQSKLVIVQKDQQIEALKEEISAIRADQSDIKKILQSKAFEKFLKNTEGE